MAEQQTPYRVLARKYRPQHFDELIGQDALVRTLRNAITSGRIAHAFMLTGVRGVGKTTTARIIAKALNYKGPDGTSGPTTGPTDDCALCRAISEDRHPDVIEMDAASRTGVDNMREILDSVRYAPTEARYKIYIIDEVHMLSTAAFNALLKTLEEPPEHVKFIFATTEIRKVPVTVLSRCQRFDLRRVDIPTLSTHYKKICGLENVETEDEAINMIARAADGSVRDGLSLLDQAIALSSEKITAQQVRDMLGLADRAQNLDLLEKALTGDMPGALEIMDGLYQSGAAPSVVIQDLLELTHLLTRLRAAPQTASIRQTLSADQIARAGDLSGKLSMPTLGKTWQILLKGLGEVNEAPNPQEAAEMVLIRLAYAADLPDPLDLLKKLKSDPSYSAPAPTPASAAPASSGAPAAQSQTFASAAPSGSGPRASAALHIVETVQTQSAPILLNTLEDMVALLEAHNKPLLASQLFHFAHLIKLEPTGRLEFRPSPEAPQKFSQDLGQVLKEITDQRWLISLATTGGQPTLAQKAENERLAELEEVLNHPVVCDIMQIFPEAKLIKVIPPEPQDQQQQET
ncbi:MAG: DNA polymerase III subunit gamma/tau [Alphaproteobacteria bacterium]|nr:DNA polymerase III subunit gamma/tau [Alphaproteobacteria bacterium]